MGAETIQTKFGEFYATAHATHRVALVLFTRTLLPHSAPAPLCRVQIECPMCSLLDTECDCARGIRAALAEMSVHPAGGVLIYFRRDWTELRPHEEEPPFTKEHATACAEILKQLGVSKLLLMTRSRDKCELLKQTGLDVTYASSGPQVVEVGDHLKHHVKLLEKDRALRPIRSNRHPLVLVLGDLNLDVKGSDLEPGGTALHAAAAFCKAFNPVVMGAVGPDLYGSKIRQRLRALRISCFLNDTDLPTGLVIYPDSAPPQKDDHPDHLLQWNLLNANEHAYDDHYLRWVLRLLPPSGPDYFYLSSHVFPRLRFDFDKFKRLLDSAGATVRRLILDLDVKSFATEILDQAGRRDLTPETALEHIAPLCERIMAVCVDAELLPILGLHDQAIPPGKGVLHELTTKFDASWAIYRYPGHDSEAVAIYSRHGESVTQLPSQPTSTVGRRRTLLALALEHIDKNDESIRCSAELSRILDLPGTNNRKRFEALCRYHQKGEVIPLIGAGMSIPSGVPSWTEFLRALSREAGRTIDSTQFDALVGTSKYEDAASLLQASLGRESFNRSVKNKFLVKRSAVAGPVRLLPRLFTSNVLTTNLDNVLEHVYALADRSSRPFSGEEIGDHEWLDDDAVRILKIHGDVGHPGTYVLTGEAYRTIYESISPARALLTELCATRHFLWLGCGLHADRTVALFSEQRGQAGRPKTHYAFLCRDNPTSSETFESRRTRLEEQGFEPIWYDGDHNSSLEALLLGMLYSAEGTMGRARGQ
jgi:GTP cyclohydrolase II